MSRAREVLDELLAYQHAARDQRDSIRRRREIQGRLDVASRLQDINRSSGIRQLSIFGPIEWSGATLR